MVVLDVSMERSKQNVCDEHTLCLLAESTAEVLPEGYQDKASWTRLSEVAAHLGGGRSTMRTLLCTPPSTSSRLSSPRLCDRAVAPAPAAVQSACAAPHELADMTHASVGGGYVVRCRPEA